MRKRVRIYRIENCRGQGAYDSGAFERRGYAHPLPDQILGNIKKAEFSISAFFYGFTSKAQLKRWFLSSDRLNLDRDGFFVSVYEIDRKFCFSDEYQAAFWKEKAEFIQDFALSTFD